MSIDDYITILTIRIDKSIIHTDKSYIDVVIREKLKRWTIRRLVLWEDTNNIYNINMFYKTPEKYCGSKQPHLNSAVY